MKEPLKKSQNFEKNFLKTNKTPKIKKNKNPQELKNSKYC